MPLPDAAIGSIIAAGIAGLVVFVSTVLTKEQKTSEFRQTWIDETRKDISQFISGTVEFIGLANQHRNDQEWLSKFFEEKFELIHDIQSIENRIILRLNTKEHHDLIIQVQEFRIKLLNASFQGTLQNTEEELTRNLLHSTKKVLKAEWERVKKGEPTFRIVKWGALASIIILTIYFIFKTTNEPPSASEKNNHKTTLESTLPTIVIENYSKTYCHSDLNNIKNTPHRKTQPKPPSLTERCDIEK